MFAVVDYRMGNLKSVERGLVGVGADARITSDPDEIVNADAVILPGVGAFADAMRSMDELGESQAIRDAIAAGKPFLGICLGLHLLFSEGVEGAPEGGVVAGLGLAPGRVTRMPRLDAAGRPYKIPHVGWNTVERAEKRAQSPLGFTGLKAPAASQADIAPASAASQADVAPASAAALFEGVSAGEHFYFTHSYIAPASPFTIAETEHSVRFPSAVALSDRVFGVQFHPEKSSDAGMRLLGNFVRLARSF